MDGALPQLHWMMFLFGAFLLALLANLFVVCWVLILAAISLLINVPTCISTQFGYYKNVLKNIKVGCSHIFVVLGVHVRLLNACYFNANFA